MEKWLSDKLTITHGEGLMFLAALLFVGYTMHTAKEEKVVEAFMEGCKVGHDETQKQLATGGSAQPSAVAQQQPAPGSAYEPPQFGGYGYPGGGYYGRG